MKQHLFNYLLQIGDNALILGHRLSEWCGHGPALEIDMAITNIALDLTGQARTILNYAAQVEGKDQNEDDLAYLRDAWDFKNILLVEQPNGDFAHTIVRQFLFDSFNYYFHRALTESKDETVAAFASKALKEIAYHLRYSSEWMIRLGDGTTESHEKMQIALDNLWMFSGEAFIMNESDKKMAEAGIGVDLQKLEPLVQEKIKQILSEATLKMPENNWQQKGGKEGQHSEHLGFILAESQFLQRAYPGQEW